MIGGGSTWGEFVSFDENHRHYKMDRVIEIGFRLRQNTPSPILFIKQVRTFILKLRTQKLVFEDFPDGFTLISPYFLSSSLHRLFQSTTTTSNFFFFKKIKTNPPFFCVWKNALASFPSSLSP